MLIVFRPRRLSAAIPIPYWSIWNSEASAGPPSIARRAPDFFALSITKAFRPSFCGWDQDHRQLRSATVRLVRPILSFDREKEISKIDIKDSNKSFPAIWRGVDSTWIVEGGVDALAVVDWHITHKVPVPSIIVSGGAGVRSFLDQPHIQELLRQAENVIITKDREKSPEVQSRTDADHAKPIMKIREIVEASVAVTEWVPPQRCKDVAEAWQQRVLPDPVAHTRQEGKGSDAAKLRPAAAACQSSTPTPFD